MREAFTAHGSAPVVDLLAWREAFLPISSASTVHSRWTACAFAEYLCSGSFPKAGGLRHQSSSWCARLSRTPTTMPPLTSQEGIGFSYGSRLPTSTILRILLVASCVHPVRLKRNGLGDVFLMPLPLSAAPEIVYGVASGLPVMPLVVTNPFTISGPTPPSVI